MHTTITKRKENYPQWYQEVIIAADLAQPSNVRGCMTINPWGYALWELIQKKLDDEIKKRGHENIYCPLLIPLSHIEKEADHIDGFAKECAVVTHSKLAKNSDGKLKPASPLEEPFIIRPTSEMMIGDVFSKKIQSHRDLPMLLNQWANVMRWEMRTRMFLRTSEFLWQEGHTAHETKKEAHEHTIEMLNCYKNICHDFLALPVVTGKKSINEKFPGAEDTYTLEGIMQDNKALQLGTSHFLGQTFSKSCDIQYQDSDKKLQYAYTTSWGVTTRLIGGLIMTHADDDGMVCPPCVAAQQIIIIPIDRKESDKEKIMAYCKRLKERLQQISFRNAPIRVYIDNKNKKPSDKKWAWIKKGAPVRIEVGNREVDDQSVCYSKRLEKANEKHSTDIDSFYAQVSTILEEIQTTLYIEAKKKIEGNNCPLIESKDALEQHFSQESPKPALIYWSDNDKAEQELQEKFKVSLRCYPDSGFFPLPEQGTSLFDPDKKGQLTLIAKAY
ncbi:MAG: proline--tRNA ligase [Pseudomonadota bacterium]|nr:proline--tRNA ligase [Pseudomonadota bacterium]